MKKHLFPFFLLATLIVCCAEEEEVFFFDPTLKVKFINADSLLTLNDSLQITNDSVTVVNDTLTYFSDSLSILEDSISVLNDSIDIGRTDYIPTRDDLVAIETTFTETVTAMEEVASLLADVITSITAVVATIEAGEVWVSKLTNTANGQSIAYEDTTDVYRVPLSMNSDDTDIEVEIDGSVYGFSLNYSREEGVDEKRRIQVLVSNIQVNSLTGFDSTSCVSNNCENESTVNFYF